MTLPSISGAGAVVVADSDREIELGHSFLLRADAPHIAARRRVVPMKVLQFLCKPPGDGNDAPADLSGRCVHRQACSAAIPAAVCPLDAWLPDATMQAIAAENNLAETAFFVPRGRRLRAALVHADRRGRSVRPRDARFGAMSCSRYLEPQRESVELSHR